MTTSFSGNIEEELKKTQIILNGTSYFNNLQFKYIKENKEIPSPVYIIPIYSSDKNPIGLFKINNKVIDFPFGISLTKDIAETEFYIIKRHGILIPEKKDQNIPYIPMQQTDLQVVFKKDTIRAIYGIQGVNELLPLVLGSETSKGFITRGFYLNNQGELKTYIHQENMRAKNYELKETIKKYFIPSIDIEETNEQNLLPTIITNKEPKVNPKDAKSIVQYLDEYVIGQDKAKKILAVNTKRFQKKMEAQLQGYYLFDSPNVLLIGPTGSGKTLLSTHIAKILDVTFAETSIADKTSAGYKGDNLSSIFLDIVKANPKTPEPFGIIFFDEFDKLVRPGEGMGERMQNEMHGWLEGTMVRSDNKNPWQINTKNLMFICAGAFYGNIENSKNTSNGLLEQIILRRLGSEKKVGFSLEKEEINITKEPLNYLIPQDLIQFGLKRELIGRFHDIATLQALTNKQMKKILTNAQDSPLEKHIKSLNWEGFNVKVTDDALNEIVLKCPKAIGARGLRQICNRIFLEIEYNPNHFAQGYNITIDNNLAKELINNS